MSGPGASRPLASDADRERLVALLREHYAVGLFGLDELDHRVETVLSARFLDEAAAAVTDLPASAPPGTAPSSGPPRRGRRRRGHAHADQPAAGWVPTSERFRDPSTSMVMRVWVDPADQSRHYVPESEP